jgi:hypothetical protein
VSTEIGPVRLDDGNLELAFDDRGRIVEFRSRETGSSYLTIPDLESNWRIMVPTTHYAIAYILGRDQIPTSVETGGNSVVYRYDSLVHDGKTYEIGVAFSARLENGEARFNLAIDNRHGKRVREVWYPILAGFEGWTVDDKSHTVNFAKSTTLAPDILHRGLPNCEYLFCVEGETARYGGISEQMNFIDLYGDRSGLYVSTDDRTYKMSVIQLEKFPPESGAGGERTYAERHLFPESTPRYLTISTGRVTAIEPGETWTSPDAVIWPHTGDWHPAADHYRAQVDRWMTWPERTGWLRNYVGWHHLIGKTYLDEYYHTFDQFAELGPELKARTGVDVVMAYGHQEDGCESAPFDISPGQSLGGPDAFARMAETLHGNGMRIMVFGHRQSALAIDDPNHPRFADWIILDRDGLPRREVWYKTTIESLKSQMGSHYEGTGPVWNRICPYCDEWWTSFRDQLLNLASLGCDGYQLDTIGVEGGLCYATSHGHKPGEGQHDKLAERLAWLRKEIHAAYPDFLLAGEELRDWQYQFLDLPYSRYRNTEGYQVFRYAFPETKENVAVGAYSYDQVNKSFLLGMGMNVEIWGLKKSVLVCPELADYIGGIVKTRRTYPDLLLNGRFRDTIGAEISGTEYGVFEGGGQKAAVLWNKTDDIQTATVAIDGLTDALICRPEQPDEAVTLPATIQVDPHRALAVVPRA